VRKTAAILLLLIFLFNIVGYRMLFDYVQHRSDAAFVTKLDKGHYDESELVAVKVPINLPYQTNWSGYERVDGEIEVDGTVYKYVKRTVQNDTMILLCIPHEEKTTLQQNANTFFGHVNDLEGNSNTKKSNSFKLLFTDYDLQLQGHEREGYCFVTPFFNAPVADYLQQYPACPGQPPEC